MGNSDQIRLIVLTACAVILAVLLFIVADRAEREITAWSVPSPDAATPQITSASAVAPFASCSSPAEWITSDDYPVEAIRREQEGVTRVQWTIGKDGRVSSCDIVESSGYAVLDRAACDAIMARGCYDPVPPERPQSRRVIWRLPREDASAF